MSWGAGAWGAFPWAAAFGSVASVQRATHAALNAVDVLFSGLVTAFDPTDPADALNPANWTLTAIDPTGALIPFLQTTELVQGSPTAGVTKTIVRLIFDADLDPDATYRITASASVEALSGAAIMAPYSADFLTSARGFVPVYAAVPREDRTDIRSVGNASQLGGTYRYDETGDLANETGVDYLRKRLIRRATTIQGTILHLPGYGAGKRLKTTITATGIANYRSGMRAQMLREPDVRGVAVAVTRAAPGILRTTIKVTDREGTLLPEITLTTDIAAGTTSGA